MFNIGPAELLVVLVIALLVLGPNKLPDAARQVGRAIGEVRRLSSGFQAEMRDALKEPVEGKPTGSSAKPPSPATGGSLSSPRPPGGDGPAAPLTSPAVVTDATGTDATGTPTTGTPTTGTEVTGTAPVVNPEATEGDAAEVPPPLATNGSVPAGGSGGALGGQAGAGTPPESGTRTTPAG
ncbi:MAG: Sec-independent protein translocase protein TatB [Actinomycetota bacterium]|nr:Sec-independent protein translocase protein TatB [Actinomycetota bacterium]